MFAACEAASGFAGGLLMTRLAFLLAGACAVALVSFGAAGDDKPEAKEQKVAERIWWGEEFELTLSAPGTGEKFQRTRAGTVWDHLVFRNCFAADGKGAIVAVVRFPKTKDEYTLRSFGPAEDLYAIQTYQLEKTFPTLYKDLVDGAKNSADVTVGGIELPANAKEIDPIPRALVPVVMTAARKYEEKRPELVLRVKKHSVLFFPRADKADWTVRREGGRLFLTTGCHDRMYYATFHVEFKKVGPEDGDWEYVRVYGEEKFKGE
jgi:hypothetical protein